MKMAAPSRAALLAEAGFKSRLEDDSGGAPESDLVFQAISWSTRDELVEVEVDGEGDGDNDEKGGGTKESMAFVIRGYGCDEQGRTVVLNVQGFTPFFYVRLEDSWTPVEVRLVVSALKSLKNRREPLVQQVRPLSRKDFYGFRNGREFNFLRLDFATLAAMRATVSMLNKHELQLPGARKLPAGALKLYESNMDPLLRFFHIRNLQPVGWIRVAEVQNSPGEAQTQSTVAVKVPWTSVFQFTGGGGSGSGGDQNQNHSRSSAPFVVSSFDIECGSLTGEFPVPKKSSYLKLANDLKAALSQFDKSSSSASTSSTSTSAASSSTAKKRPSEYETKGFILKCLRQALLGCPGGSSSTAAEESIPGISRIVFKASRNLGRMLRLLEARLPLLADDVYLTVFSPHRAPCKDLTKVLDDALLSISDLQQEGDPVIQIGTTFGVFGRPLLSGDSHQRRRHIVTLGSCSDVPGSTVVPCKTERDLLLTWARMMSAADPDVLMGYNIMGFDMWYLKERAEEVGCLDEFMRCLSRLHSAPATYREVSLSSSALGDNLLKVLDIPGRVIVDLMKVVQRDHKLDSYKLDAVAEHFTGSKKDDVSPSDIFRLQRGSADDRAVIAAYCLQDCELVLKLAWKLEVLANNIGMANVCTVPLTYIFMRGQGIKIFSLVAKQCRAEGYLIPAPQNQDQGLDQGPDQDGYEGALVLEPQAGIYMQPVSVLDYASLYPSSMISENLSHDSIVLDPKYANIPGVEYLDIAYDIYEGTGSAKVKIGERVCRFAQGFQGRKAIIPRILQHLVAQRKATRALIEGAADNFQKAVLDGLQLAYKVTANSLYGALGARTNPLYLKDIAACTTATGRSLIMKAKEFVQSQFGAKVIYGDSVPGYTPVPVRISSPPGLTPPLPRVYYVTIELLANLVLTKSPFSPQRPQWIQTDDGKEALEVPALGGGSVEVWSDRGWVPLLRIIRHRLDPRKRMFRVATRISVVDVTEDHSLLRADTAEPLRPVDAFLGTRLLHARSHPLPRSANPQPCAEQPTFGGYYQNPSDLHDADKSWRSTFVSVDEARIMGMVLGCHALAHRDHLFIWSPARGMIDSYYEMCHNAFPNVNWDIDFSVEEAVWSLTPSGRNAFDLLVYFLQNMTDSTFASSWSQLDPEVRRFPNFTVPDAILSSPSIVVRQAFLDGFQTSNPDMLSRTQLLATTLHALTESIWMTPSLVKQVVIPLGQVTAYKIDAVSGFVGGGAEVPMDSVVEVRELTLEEVQESREDEILVYDLTTESGHFAAGIGRMVVHNTDSIFCIFPEGERLSGTDALEASIAAGKAASRAFKAHLKPPHDLEYEKTFWPFIILSKKRYVGNLYENSVDHFKQKSMGIVLKRRDNAPIVKHIYSGIINIILNEQDIEKSVAFLKMKLEELIAGRLLLEDLVITKSLRTGYKNPEQIAHNVLAQRMGDRDPGNRPQASDRIPFVYIQKHPSAVTLQGDRIEHPEFVVKNSLKVDYKFYIEHQIMKPVLQLFAIVLERLDGYALPKNHWKKEFERLRVQYDGDVAKAQERINDLREREVQRLLFDPVLLDKRLQMDKREVQKHQQEALNRRGQRSMFEYMHSRPSVSV